jgi:hypothetical protein
MPLPRWLAHINKRVFNPMEVRRGARPVLIHTGRSSGKTYRTPGVRWKPRSLLRSTTLRSICRLTIRLSTITRGRHTHGLRKRILLRDRATPVSCTRLFRPRTLPLRLAQGQGVDAWYR